MKTLALKGGTEVAVSHTSNQFAIGWKDGLKALIIAAATPVADYAYQAVQAYFAHGLINFDVKTAIGIGVSAGITYLGKNYLTPGQIVIKKTALDEAK